VPRGTAVPEDRQDFEAPGPRAVDAELRQYRLGPANWAAGMETWWTLHRTMDISPATAVWTLPFCNVANQRHYSEALLEVGCLSIEGRTPANQRVYLVTVVSCDLDLDPKTLIYELDIDIVKTCLRTKNKVSKSMFSQVRAQTGHTGTQTDETERINTPQVRYC